MIKNRRTIYKKALKYFLRLKSDNYNAFNNGGICYAIREAMNDTAVYYDLAKFPELEIIKKGSNLGNGTVLNYWWDVNDYDARVNALKRAIKLVPIMNLKLTFKKLLKFLKP